MDRVRVRVADPESNRVTLWERHPQHPGGEVWLAGAGEFDVAATPAVVARLRSGSLVQVEAAAPTPETVPTGERPEKDAQVETAVPALTQPPPGGRKDAAGEEGKGRVLPAEEPSEEVTIVTRAEGPGAPRSRPQRKPRGSA